MNLYAFDIPDAPADLAPWLERQLTGLHLAELVAELVAVHGASAADDRSLEEVLGPHLQQVLDSGLSAAPLSVLQDLLRHPEILLALQERLLIDGGAYWDGVEEDSAAFEEQVARGWQQLSKTLGEDVAPAGAVKTRLVEPEPTAARPAAKPRSRSWGLMLVTTAAALAVGFFLGDRFGPPPPQVATGWGWQRPGALDAVGSQKEYLNHLANAADEWFKKRPETPAALAKRISEFRDGCTTLLLAEHRPLTAETKAWLRERCSVWAGKLDAHRAALEAGQPVPTVRDAADDTIRKLIQAMRKKAEEVVG